MRDAASAGGRLGHRRPLVLVALSGGADSLALAAATAFEAPRAGWRAGAVIVDHGLQRCSSGVRAAAAPRAPSGSTRCSCAASRSPARAAPSRSRGPLRRARRRRRRDGAALVLLGHTLDDQAETVLLGLARGSGAASLAGMPARSGRYARPLLGIRRATTRQACLDAGLEPWDDPHNADPAYARVRVRERVLPVLEAELGPGVAEALARTAEQLREDEQAFAEQIDEFIEEICEPAEAGIAVRSPRSPRTPPRSGSGSSATSSRASSAFALAARQTLEVARLVTDWHGQGPIDLPGMPRDARRTRIVFTAGLDRGPR